MKSEATEKIEESSVVVRNKDEVLEVPPESGILKFYHL